MNNARSVLDQATGRNFPLVDQALKNMMRRSTDHLPAGQAALSHAVPPAAPASLAKAEFLATMSHEIRTPLNAMLGMLKLALQTNLNAEQAEYLGLMKEAGGSLLAVINDILDFSRIEARQFEIETLPFSLHACLGDTLKMLSLEAHQKGLALLCDIAPEVPDTLLGDPMRLRQIVVNLVGNAIKFSDRGDIVVRVVLLAGNRDEISCHFSVSDQGIGIPREQQGAIFEPYRQVDRSVARRYGGSGLGLSISAQLVDMMDGTIWLDSTPGQGSTFHFTACFGRQSGTALPAAAQLANRQPACGPGPALEILLVEDNPTNRRLAQITLEKAGHRVILAESGAAAQAVLKVASPDLILMDLQMPDMDGLQTTKTIRSREALFGGHIPIIAHTARAMAEDRVRCLQAGMDDYLAKPLDPQALLGAIDRIAHQPAKGKQAPRRAAALDRAALFLQVNGDGRLLAEIRDLFLRDCGPLMSALRQALASHDEARFAHLVHTLRGMFRSLSANTAQEIAGYLEELSTDHVRAEITYTRLEQEVRALKSDLLAMVRNLRMHHPVVPHANARTRIHPACAGGVQAGNEKSRQNWKGLARVGLRGAGRRFSAARTQGESQ